MEQKMPTLLCLSGSIRKESFNKKLISSSIPLLEKTSANIINIDLKEYPLPIYNGDLEENEGKPENAQKLTSLFSKSDGFLISSPEYNGSITPLLKNTIDWISRPNHQSQEPPLSPFKGKTALLVSASPGALGGIRGLVHTRAILTNLGVHVFPQQFCLNQAFEAFTQENLLNNADKIKTLQQLIVDWTEFTKKITL